jgi:tetratricopeptide (TPR) repeat protein
MGAQRAGAPVLSGSVPPLAAFFHSRQETGFGLADGLRPGETTLLIPGQPGTGGTGKTQLAVGFAHAMWAARAVDLLVWVPAGHRGAIVAGYAQAAADARPLTGDEAGQDNADSAAYRFLDWLSGTQRRWTVVLDGVRSPGDLDGLWPQGPGGQVIVTSRLGEPDLPVPGPADAVSACAVGGFSRRESLGYLNARLTAFPDQRIAAIDLAEDVGGLPIALAQAAAVVAATGATCRDYRDRYARRITALAGTLVDDCPQPLLATWSIAVEQAHALAPAGLSWPALVFASALDADGIPEAVLTSPAACGYIAGTAAGGHQDSVPAPGQAEPGAPAGPAGPAGYREPPVRPDGAPGPGLVRAAYANLERLGLVSVDTACAERTVWLHTAMRAAVRAYLAPGNVEYLVEAAADALAEAWPEPGDPAGSPQLSQALRDSAAALRSFAGDLLWAPGAHPVLLRAGESLGEPPAQPQAAIGYWQAMTDASTRLLGPGHEHSALARERLADACAAAGRLAEAVAVFQATLADREATLGQQHPDTVSARLNAARALHAAGQDMAAIELQEQALTARELIYGPGHSETLAVRLELAGAYEAAGRLPDSIRLYERGLSDAERELGPAHRDTLTARAGLAAARLASGQAGAAVSGYERALTEAGQAADPDDPAIADLRAGLAAAYQAAGRFKEAMVAYQRVLADRERLLGPGHSDTLAARSDLGHACRVAGRLKEAITHYERAAAGRERAAGPADRDTLAARAALAAAYQQGRRLRDAIDGYEQVVADSERALGPGDIDTLTRRCGLAAAYYEAGRPSDGVQALGRALADCERYLGPEHPLASQVRESLQMPGAGRPARA